MSRPFGFPLDILGLCRGELAGDSDVSENAVAGESASLGFAEFQPKKEVKPPAGDLGLPRLSGRYESSWSSAASSLSLRSGGRVSDAYDGIVGIVGDRACAFAPTARSSSVLLCLRGWNVLAGRSFRAEEVRFAEESESLRTGNGFWARRGVCPRG
jgi:hypothetical protein